MPDITYRLSWEMVKQGELYRYCDANPTFYSNTKQIVPNSRIPDEHWGPVSKVTDNPWQQYYALKKRTETDEGFVRQVTLEQAEIVAPDWRPVPDGRPVSSTEVPAEGGAE